MPRSPPYAPLVPPHPPPHQRADPLEGGHGSTLTAYPPRHTPPLARQHTTITLPHTIRRPPGSFRGGGGAPAPPGRGGSGAGFQQASVPPRPEAACAAFGPRPPGRTGGVAGSGGCALTWAHISIREVPLPSTQFPSGGQHGHQPHQHRIRPPRHRGVEVVEGALRQSDAQGLRQDLGFTHHYRHPARRHLRECGGLPRCHALPR